ncbi:MAG: rod shape-determining protein MreD [Oscillospiraceae bacterium]|jgi:rod shape-determining protein MreD|nr:rod shape-determining protein MreD [Oscillospiraceae bacterium]
MKILNKLGIKWLAYSLELFIAFILGQTPGLIPRIFGVLPMLPICVCVCIALFEGEFAGLLFGAAGGLLMDFSGTKVFGFHALFLTILCYVCGMFVVYLMRNNIVTCMLLGTGSLLIIGIMRWLFLYVIWDYDGLWYLFYSVILPSVGYSMVLLPVFFYLNKVIATHLSTDA